MVETGWGSYSDILTAVATAAVAFLTFLLCCGLIFAYMQWKHARVESLLQLAQQLHQLYDSPKYDDAIKLLASKKGQYSNLKEFLEVFSDVGNDNAREARRKFKSIFIILGYIHKFDLVSPEELFPLTPTSIELWADLHQVEYDLIVAHDGQEVYKRGWDAVALIDELYTAYLIELGKADNLPPRLRALTG